MAKYQYLVFTNPAEGREDEYNRWYDDVHLGEVTAIPGFTGARRLRVVLGDGPAPQQRYLAIYDIESDDPTATLGELMSRAQSGALQMSDALGSDVVTYLYEALPSAVSK